MSFLSLLPDDIIRDIALFLSLPEIKSFGLTNSQFNRIICRNEDFWRRKFIHDYQYSPPNYRDTWLHLYQHYGNVWVCGDNSHGQLGLNYSCDLNVNVPTRIKNINLLVKARQISAGANHTIILDLNNNVWTCGLTMWGQLGLGDTQSNFVNVPTQIPNINLLGKTQQISAGPYHTIIIDLENNVWVCGDNDLGSLGLSDGLNRNVPTKIPNIKAKQVATGINHTVLVDLENNVWVCGSNQFGQLGLRDIQYRFELTPIPNIKAQRVSAGYHYTVIIDLENNVWVCGWNNGGVLGLDDNTETQHVLTQIPGFKAKQVATGPSHTVMIDMNDNVWLCGFNTLEKLGFDRCQFSPRMIPNIKAQQISAGCQHTVMIDLENNVWSWGNKLGLGDNAIEDVVNQIPNIKAQQVAAGGSHTVIIGYIN